MSTSSIIVRLSFVLNADGSFNQAETDKEYAARIESFKTELATSNAKDATATRLAEMTAAIPETALGVIDSFKGAKVGKALLVSLVMDRLQSADKTSAKAPEYFTACVSELDSFLKAQVKGSELEAVRGVGGGFKRSEKKAA